MFLKKIDLIPIYLDTHLVVAQGVKNGGEEEWEQLMDMYSSVASTIDYDVRAGTKGEGRE